MKTRILLIAVTLIPCLLFGQGEVPKQSFTQTSGSSCQNQPSQGCVQNQNTYQPKQSYQSTPQNNQPQNQQYQPVRQDNSQLQSGYHYDTKYQNSNSYPGSSKINLNRTEKESGLSSLMKIDSYYKINATKFSRLSSSDLHLLKYGSVKPHNTSICSLTDNSGSHQTGEFVLEEDPVKKSYVPRCPEVVYKLTPTLRLRCVVGEFRGECDLNGFGVHIATFLNYDYCVAVAKWIRNKYHATSYVFEEQRGYPHYHLVFGRWTYYKSAEIFEDKVRRDAPHAFVIRWRSDFSVLLPNGMLMPGY
jgi:hypothetical protein